MPSCWCGYTAPCKLQVALHILLVHADGEVALVPGEHPDECFKCLMSDLALYELAPNGQGGYAGAARVGTILMQLPSVRGLRNGTGFMSGRGGEA
jgi:hypothetical protein